jgi:hypothetical protein
MKPSRMCPITFDSNGPNHGAFVLPERPSTRELAAPQECGQDRSKVMNIFATSVEIGIEV